MHRVDGEEDGGRGRGEEGRVLPGGDGLAQEGDEERRQAVEGDVGRVKGEARPGAQQVVQPEREIKGRTC